MIPDLEGNLDELEFHTSSHSGGQEGGGGECVQLALPVKRDLAVVRDSKNVDGPVLAFRRAAWLAFVDEVRSGRLNR